MLNQLSYVHIFRRNLSAVYSEYLNGTVADIYYDMYCTCRSQINEHVVHIGKGADYTVYSPVLQYQGHTPYGSIVVEDCFNLYQYCHLFSTYFGLNRMIIATIAQTL